MGRMTPARKDFRKKQIQEKNDDCSENRARQTNAKPRPENEEIDDQNEESCQPAVTQRPAKEPFHEKHQENDDKKPQNAGCTLLLSREEVAGNVVEQCLGKKKEEEFHSVVSATIWFPMVGY